MFEMNTVAKAVAPLTKVRENLKRVAENRKALASERRSVAKDFLAKAEIDDGQYENAILILDSLNKLLTPTKES